jgi:hypothetical protein
MWAMQASRLSPLKPVHTACTAEGLTKGEPMFKTLMKEFAGNVVFSIVAILICTFVFALLGLVCNFIANEEGARFMWHYRDSASGRAVDMYYRIRDLSLLVGACVGLVSSQVVWCVSRLSK